GAGATAYTLVRRVSCTLYRLTAAPDRPFATLGTWKVALGGWQSAPLCLVNMPQMEASFRRRWSWCASPFPEGFIHSAISTMSLKSSSPSTRKDMSSQDID